MIHNARGRFSVDYRGRTGVQRELEAGATVTVEQAAATILDGVERGKARVLVGKHAVATDILVRLAPVGCSAVVEGLAARRFD